MAHEAAAESRKKQRCQRVRQEKMPIAEKVCVESGVDGDLQKQDMQLIEERLRLQEEKAALHKADLHIQEERQRLVEERAVQVQEAEQRLAEERIRIAADAEKHLEEERSRIAEEEKKKFEEEMQRLQTEHQHEIDVQRKEWLAAQESAEMIAFNQLHSKQAAQQAAFNQQMQEIEQERTRMSQEAAESEQIRERISQEAEEMAEKKQQLKSKLQEAHACAEETKRKRKEAMEYAARMCEEEAAKVRADKERLLQERKVFEEEKERFRRERERLEEEHRRLQEEVRSARKKLRQVEQHRIDEEKRLAAAQQKQKAFTSAAALATADHSKDVDPSLTDLRQRAVAKATVLSRKIGSVVFTQLLDQVVGQLDSADAKLFQQKLASGDLLDVQSTCICSLELDDCSIRGGKPYFKPSGWIRCGLGAAVDVETENWCVAYHGTTNCNALRIMLHGLKRPGQSGVHVAHGQVHSDSGASIYLSPSIEYSAFPCYSQLFRLGDEHWAQLVLECHVRPGSFKEAAGTLSSNKHWPNDVSIDQNFSSLDGMEWLLERPDDIRVSALLIREFGKGADAAIYGDLVTKVKSPEYVWTELRIDDARSRSQAGTSSQR
jgi:hypothetical protein